MGTIYKAYVIGFGFHRRALHVCVWRRDERERERGKEYPELGRY